MKCGLLKLLTLTVASVLLAVPAAYASTGNEVAIETIEFYSPIEVGTWVIGQKSPACKFTTDPGVTVVVPVDKKMASILLNTELGERCAVNTQTGRVMPFFMGTSMATPALK